MNSLLAAGVESQSVPVGSSTFLSAKAQFVDANFLPLECLLSCGRVADAPVALQLDGTTLQMQNFAAFSAHAAAWYHAFCQEKEGRVALYFEDAAQFSAALFGAWHAGKCVYLPNDVLPNTLSHLKAEVSCFASDTRISSVRQIDAIVGADAVQWLPLDSSVQGLVVYTSGTSGAPIAITKRLAQLFDEVASLAECFSAQTEDLGRTSVVFSSVSHQHIYGLLFRVLWPLASGRAFAAQRLVYPEQIAAVLSTHVAPILIASPAHLKRLPEQLPWSAVRECLLAVFSSGGSLSQDALVACRALLGKAPIEIYGSSETGGIAWRQRSRDDALTWTTLPKVEVALHDGLLRVRSPYLNDHHWYQTSDLVDLSQHGFELKGRSDRVIKIEERRVSLSAMEQALLHTGLIDDARVLAVDGIRLSLGVVAVPSDAGWAMLDTHGKRAVNEALRSALANVVESSALPRRWRYTWALPVNAQGKTPESALLAMFDLRRPITRLLSRDNENAVLRLSVSDESPFFEGHFDAAPILPGVVQIDWAVALGRELFALPPDFLRMEAIKFQQVILPNATVELTLTLKEHQSKSASEAIGSARQCMLSFKFQSSVGQHASGRLIFGSKIGDD